MNIRRLYSVMRFSGLSLPRMVRKGVTVTGLAGVGAGLYFTENKPAAKAKPISQVNTVNLNLLAELTGNANLIDETPDIDEHQWNAYLHLQKNGIDVPLKKLEDIHIFDSYFYTNVVNFLNLLKQKNLEKIHSSLDQVLNIAREFNNPIIWREVSHALLEGLSLDDIHILMNSKTIYEFANDDELFDILKGKLSAAIEYKKTKRADFQNFFAELVNLNNGHICYNLVFLVDKIGLATTDAIKFLEAHPKFNLSSGNLILKLMEEGMSPTDALNAAAFDPEALKAKIYREETVKRLQLRHEDLNDNHPWFNTNFCYDRALESLIKYHKLSTKDALKQLEIIHQDSVANSVWDPEACEQSRLSAIIRGMKADQVSKMSKEQLDAFHFYFNMDVITPLMISRINHATFDPQSLKYLVEYNPSNLTRFGKFKRSDEKASPDKSQTLQNKL